MPKKNMIIFASGRGSNAVALQEQSTQKLKHWYVTFRELRLWIEPRNGACR